MNIVEKLEAEYHAGQQSRQPEIDNAVRILNHALRFTDCECGDCRCKVEEDIEQAIKALKM
jgi:hypothetical protein